MNDVANKSTDKAGPKPEIKPIAKAENKQAITAETKPADKREIKPAGKTENRQAGKGSKRRPFNAKQFSANYDAIRWGGAQSQKPKH